MPPLHGAGIPGIAADGWRDEGPRGVCALRKGIDTQSCRKGIGMTDQILDAQGLLCPMPVLEAKKALVKMAAGATLKIIATDPAAKGDFEVFCRNTGHELLESSQDGPIYSFRIRRSA
jgi:tRNA 2-thiouridine synthesizing protein A